jgi:hypothetical protein
LELGGGFTLLVMVLAFAEGWLNSVYPWTVFVGEEDNLIIDALIADVIFEGFRSVNLFCSFNKTFRWLFSDSHQGCFVQSSGMDDIFNAFHYIIKGNFVYIL